MEGDTEEPATTSSSSGKSNNTLKIIGAVVIIIVLAFATWELALKDKMAGSEMTASPTPSESGMEVAPTTAVATYKDGVYRATGTYQNPAGTETLDVSVTITGGNVTAASFTGTPDNPTTTTMQNKVKQGLATEVIGKPVDQINLTVVNGSSLTPKGFMDALNQVKTQAQG